MESSDEEQLILSAILHRRRKKRRNRRYWIHPLNLTRNTWGEHLKIEEMYTKYPDRFVSYTRLSPRQFDTVLNLVGHTIQKQLTNYRKPLSSRFRLFLTLRYLATGDNIQSLATSYSIGVSTAWIIIRETTAAIWVTLQHQFVKAPDVTGWGTIAEEFYSMWNYPNCLGGIDGKHVVIEAPPKSGSLYYNYKGTFSIILLATCDANYKFTTIDVGAYGKQSDGGVFSASGIGSSLEEGSLNLPGARTLPNSSTFLPYHFVGDEAFPLRLYMMRPFPGKSLNNDRRIFNYRLSRARRVIENSFGIMATRFRIFRKPIAASPDHVTSIVKACVALHNFLRMEEQLLAPNNRTYCPQGYVDDGDNDNGGWRSNGETNALQNLSHLSSNMHSRAAKEMRDQLVEYFVNEGTVYWQDMVLQI